MRRFHDQEEGCYTTEAGKILFYFLTESFFKDS